ncbi:hotdog fold thioesterase [Frankia sp. AgB1.9]|uniref:PaaI family thioesterase n=1 Tax=unclassified Frankia TaxID=2632575 RepID=UPI00193278B8|nr:MULTISPECIES: hotdog fold thioesterase [unclassified Frankia]MBL7493903.1 hotdog fold thioesterase [Frankia sp. AgW1.1]MBL7552634.1 hotdog fold thioesterase [Frankia sp. AgB1.9]MBL7620010.1 hotdog fold thioesterase [Frankia sp. AgB1.8]
MTVETDPADAAGPSEPTDLLAQLNTYRGELPQKLGIELLEATPERVVGQMPVEGNRQPYGLLHGGASVALAETVGSIAAMLNAGPGRAAVGLDINATHHRALTSGTVTAVATRIHAGRSAAMFDIHITDEQGRPVCTSRLTCLLRDQPPAGGTIPGRG